MSTAFKGHDYFVKGVLTYIKSNKTGKCYQIYLPNYHGNFNSDRVSKSDNDNNGKYPFAQANTALTLEQIGAIVWVTFEGGDIRNPIIFGNVSDKAIVNSSDFPGLAVAGKGGVYDATTISINYASIAYLAAEIVYGNESSRDYGAINPKDSNGALSIGLIQWNGDNARTLIQRIRDEYPNDFTNAGGNNLTLALNKSWSNQSIAKGDSNYNILKALLTSNGGKAIQDAMAIEYMNNYINTAKSVGFTDMQGLLYYCDCATQSPAGAKEAASKCSPKTLDGIHNWVLTSGCWLGKNTPQRRKNTYNKIKKMAANGELDNYIVSDPNKPFLWPVPYPDSYISSGYSVRTLNGKTKMHTGIDIVTPGADQNNKIIIACAAGTVVKVDNECTHNYPKNGPCNHAYGNCVFIKHDNNIVSMYLHLYTASVKVGDKVAAGQVIGIMGCTGYSTGHHLHFQIQENGSTTWGVDHVDPNKYVGKA